MLMTTHLASDDTLADAISSDDHLKGALSAPILLLEYGDYECPGCLNAWPIVRELQQTFGPQLAFAFRHFPQSSIHPHASAAAQAAEAAGAQGKYWEMHDLLFAHQQDLATLDLTHLALRLGLEVYRFQSSLDDEKIARKVRDDFDGGRRSGVDGTPTFFLNGFRYRGPVNAGAMGVAIQLLLNPSPPVDRH
jgi:NhaA family Na+:H+ antiporter